MTGLLLVVVLAAVSAAELELTGRIDMATVLAHLWDVVIHRHRQHPEADEASPAGRRAA